MINLNRPTAWAARRIGYADRSLADTVPEDPAEHATTLSTARTLGPDLSLEGCWVPLSPAQYTHADAPDTRLHYSFDDVPVLMSWADYCGQISLREAIAAKIAEERADGS